MSYLHAIILGIVEGITEFLPISSTGHMIIASSMMGIEDSSFTKAFEVIIQFGAIMSVLVLYWKRFLPHWGFYRKLFVAFLPTAVIGFVVKDVVEHLMGSVQVVAWSLIIGGAILIWADRAFAHLTMMGRKTDDLTYKDSVKLGLFQAIGQQLPQETRDPIIAAPGGKGHDQLDRLGRIVIGARVGTRSGKRRHRKRCPQYRPAQLGAG